MIIFYGKTSTPTPKGVSSSFLSDFIFGSSSTFNANNKNNGYDPHCERDNFLARFFNQYANKVIAPTMMVPIIGAVVIAFVLCILAISYVVHLQYAYKRRMHQVLLSNRAIWQTAPGEGRVLLRDYVYSYTQSAQMAKGVCCVFCCFNIFF